MVTKVTTRSVDRLTLWSGDGERIDIDSATHKTRDDDALIQVKGIHWPDGQAVDGLEGWQVLASTSSDDEPDIDAPQPVRAREVVYEGEVAQTDTRATPGGEYIKLVCEPKDGYQGTPTPAMIAP